LKQDIEEAEKAREIQAEEEKKEREKRREERK
jgi:hypothetical protein